MTPAKIFFVFLPVFLVTVFSVFAAFPRPQNYLSDFAGVVEPEWAAAINRLGADVERNSSAQVFVVTVNDTGGSAKDYATRLFNEWGIGTEQEDNGVLIILAFFPQRRIEIETGYGVEGLLPDSKVGRIRDEFTPLLTAGNYGEGLYRMADAVGGVIAGSGEFSGGLWGEDDIALFVAIVIIFIIVFFGMVALAGSVSSVLRERRERCPACKAKMKLVKTASSGGYIITEFECPACGKKVKKKRYRGHYWIVAGGFGGYGGSGGGFGGGGFGGGGGGSGGGGAGGGF